MAKYKLKNYPELNFYDVFCQFPNIDSAILPTKLHVVENYDFNSTEFDLLTNTIDISVEVQPMISDILPSNFYPQGQDGTITIEGDFDVSRTLYLRMTRADSLFNSVIVATTLTETNATYYISASDVPVAGVYLIDVFYGTSPLEEDYWNRYEASEDRLTSELNVIYASGNSITTAFPLSIPASTSGQMLTIQGHNFTIYTL